MSETDNGGPAFPGGCLPPRPHTPNGMSMRDWFAGQALPTVIEVCRTDHIEGGDYPAHCARFAYAVADAMLAARTEKSDG